MVLTVKYKMCNYEKNPEKGGCQGTGFLGIYYEKVI